MPERRKVYGNGTIKNGKPVDSRDSLLGVKGLKSDRTPLPEWATDREAVGRYQDYINTQETATGRKPPITNFGSTGYDKGRYGPQTASTYDTYGKAFEAQDKKPTQSTVSGRTPAFPSPADGSPKPIDFNFGVPKAPGSDTVPTYLPASTDKKFGREDAAPERINFKEPQMNMGTPKATELSIKPQGTTTITGRKKAFGSLGDIVPYISNIANSFRNVPLPSAPGMINPVARRQVNYDAQRVEADRQMRGANGNADRMLDENTSAAYKGSTLASNIRTKNSISEAETNTNAQLGMQTDQINAGIEGQNVGMMNQWKNDLVQGQVAQQREQSANLSNAADKYIMQQNVNGQRDLDRKRLGIYKGLYENSGVMDRRIDAYDKYLNENGYNDDVILPKKVNSRTGTVLRYGGSMRKKVY